MRGISWLAQDLLGSQEGFCSMELDLERGDFRPRSQCVCRSLRGSYCLFILTCFCHVSHRSGRSPNTWLQSWLQSEQSVWRRPEPGTDGSRWRSAFDWLAVTRHSFRHVWWTLTDTVLQLYWSCDGVITFLSACIQHVTHQRVKQTVAHNDYNKLKKKH
jgi:hypothetical protein